MLGQRVILGALFLANKTEFVSDKLNIKMKLN